MFVKMVCPLCGQFLMKQRRDIKTDVKLVKLKEINMDTEFAIKCVKCKNELAIKKIS